MTKFSSTYPNIAAWTESYGWIEIGQDDESQSFIRVLDIGGIRCHRPDRFYRDAFFIEIL